MAVAGLALLAARSDQPTPVDPGRIPTLPQPLLISTPVSYTDVSTGDEHTCALRADGVAERCIRRTGDRRTGRPFGLRYLQPASSAE